MVYHGLLRDRLFQEPVPVVNLAGGFNLFFVILVRQICADDSQYSRWLALEKLGMGWNHKFVVLP